MTITTAKDDVARARVHNRVMGRPQRRAVQPDHSGFAERAGVRLAYDVYGSPPGENRPTVLLLPSWQIIDSRFWKLQTGPLSRRFRVITYDGRGTGRSSAPVGAAEYTDLVCAEDVVTVLDATATRSAVLVGLSCAATWAVHAAAS